MIEPLYVPSYPYEINIVAEKLNEVIEAVNALTGEALPEPPAAPMPGQLTFTPAESS